jgi:hypothetical protein
MNNIVIIGAGASGLAAGAVLSKAGKKCTIIERNGRVGKKLLATGNGRCNLGNVHCTVDNVQLKYHGDVDFARQIFADWQGAEKFFAGLGLVCKADSQGRLYPYSNTANSVVDALRFACKDVQFLCDTECTSLPKADKIIWACGNSGMSILKHKIIEPFPALCPVITDKSLTRPLKGLRVRAVCSAIVNGKIIKSETGEVQFNEGSLSGICIMNLSRLVRDHSSNLTISLDIAPEFTIEQLREIPLRGLFHSRIVCVIKELSTVKDWRFPVTGVASWNQAQIMSGGVSAAELNYDMSSKIHPNLYIIGEAVNVDGDCGGYNLEWAWASAFAAARACI